MCGDPHVEGGDFRRGLTVWFELDDGGPGSAGMTIDGSVSQNVRARLDPEAPDQFCRFLIHPGCLRARGEHHEGRLVE